MNSEPLTFENLRAGLVIVHENILRDRKRGPLWFVLSIKQAPHTDSAFARVSLRSVLAPDVERVVEFRLMRGIMCILHDTETITHALDRIMRLDAGRELSVNMTNLHALKLQLPSHAQEALEARERIAKKRRARIADEFWQGSDKRPRR